MNCTETTPTTSDTAVAPKTYQGAAGRPGNKHPRWKGYGLINGKFWSSIKYRAKISGLAFELTIGYINDLLIAQDMKCALSGRPIEPPRDSSKMNHTASLDRIDSSRGYVPGNVQWVHKDVNTMKHTFDQDYFIALCRSINEVALKVPPNLIS